MANRYWVGGGGTWDASTTNWSATSGGAGGASVPTSFDNVIFNSASSASSYSVVIDLTAFAQTLSLTISGPASGTLSISSTGSGSVLIVSDITTASSNVDLSAFAGTFTFENAFTGNISIGTALTNGTVRIDLVSGAVKRLTAPLVCKNLYIADASSKLTTNGYDITCSGLLAIGSVFGGAAGFITSSTESIYLTGNNQTIYQIVGTVTNTGTVNIRCTYAGSTGTRAFTSNTSISGVPNIYISAGSDTVSIFNSTFNQYKNVDFTGFSGSISGSGNGSLEGSLTLSSGMTVSGYTGDIVVSPPSGTATVTTAGKSCAFALGAGGANVQLGGAFTTTKSVGIGSVTFNTQGYNVTSLSLSQTAGALTLGATTWTLTGSGTVLTLGSGTTQSLGTSTFVFTSASSKTATVNANSLPSITQSGAGLLILTYTGPINIANLTTTVSPTALQFTSSQTATITGNFTVSGSAGNLVTITSSTDGTAATLSKSSGVINSNYLSLKDSTATGGATWYAGSSSTNVSGNTGWIFADVSSGGMLFFFS